MDRIVNEQYPDTMTRILKYIGNPLDFNDFIYSIVIAYKPCYRKVLENDANRYKDGDLSMFGKIRMQDL